MVWRGLVHSRGFAALAEALERHVSPVARAVLQAPFVFGDTTEQLRTPRLSAPLRMASAAECIRFERESFGAFNQLMAHLPPEKREAIWDEAEVAMQVFEGPQGFQAPCEPLLAVGVM